MSYAIEVITSLKTDFHVLTQEVITLGRGKDVDISLEKDLFKTENEWRTISRVSCTFVREESTLGENLGYYILDGDGKQKNNLNGVYVNDVKVTDFTKLVINDQIRISSKVLIVYKLVPEINEYKDNEDTLTGEEFLD